MQRNMFRLLSLALLAACPLFLMPAYASTTNCPSAAAAETDYTGSSYDGSSVTKVAVASNFTGPIATVVNSFLTAHPTYKVIVCGDSTGNLESTIVDPTSLPYSMFFAADASPETLYSDYTTFRYAYGIPVVFGYLSGKTYTVSGVSDLVSGTVTNNTVPASPSGLSAYKMSTTLTAGTGTVDIADPAKAPYGLAAQDILTDMGYTVTTSSTPTWLVSPITTYGNITLAYNAVGGTTKAGFVSKAQICGHISDSPATIAWVQFTYSSLNTDQWAVNFGTDTVGSALYTFINNEMNSGTTPTTWNAFLEGACYNDI